MPPTPAAHDPSTRDRLLAAAYELLIEDGVEAPTIQDVARRAGLSNGAIYANFATRHELLLEVALRCWSRLPQAGLLRLATALDLPEDAGAEDLGIDELVALLARQQSAPPGPEYRLLADVTSTAMRDPDTARRLRAGLDRLRSVATDSIEQAKADGTVGTRHSTDALVALIVDLYLGAVVSKSLNLRQPEQADLLAVLHKLLPPT
jgi:AcrR family transcriptional regulator